MLPEAGRLMASAVDEVDDDPCDAQPDDYDVALAAHRLEEWTTLTVSRVAHRWAGLRTFTPDRVPVAGFAPDAPGFFWLAGQGGYGLQTAPAMAAAVASLIADTPWPDVQADAAALAPERLGRPRPASEREERLPGYRLGEQAQGEQHEQPGPGDQRQPTPSRR
jgi:D-arginine dehydrogenase